MKRRLLFWMFSAIMILLAVPAAWGQFLVTVKGYVHDSEGQPLAGAVLQLTNKENGRRYDLKTNNKGEYYSIGILSGRYDIVVIKDKRELWKAGNVPFQNSEKENEFDVDLKKELASQQAALPPEVKKKQEEQVKEVTKIKTLNDKLAQAKAATDAGDTQQAVTILTEATQVDPSQPVIWAALAEAQRTNAAKQADPAGKKAEYANAVESFKKAIALRPTGSYYNNMGDAMVRSGDTAAALQAYEEAVKIDPANAAQYYFNEGAVLTNAFKITEANQAFDKAIQADPTKAEAYYQKAMNLISQATLKGNKMEAPPGTEATLKKYLELQPTGEHAEIAKQMLDSMGATVETSFGKGKTAPKTKK